MILVDEGMEDKFIVISRKRINEMMECQSAGKEAVENLLLELERFSNSYKYLIGKKMDQKYIVCNQDEPYAQKVWEIIKEATCV